MSTSGRAHRVHISLLRGRRQALHGVSLHVENTAVAEGSRHMEPCSRPDLIADTVRALVMEMGMATSPWTAAGGGSERPG